MIVGFRLIRTVNSILLLSLSLSTAGMASSPVERTILVLGDSLSAGYGLDPTQAYPARLQQKILGEGLQFRVINAGVSGDTSAGGLRRINWLLRGRIDILILELGANDGLRGIALDSTQRNLQEIIDRTRTHSPEVKVVIAGMLIPPNLGPDYTERFRQLFRELADRNKARLIPFLLSGVAGDPALNLPDGIHPTAEGHRIVAETVWSVLKPLLVSLEIR